MVVARARRILSELDALVSDVAACKDEVTGTVRVGMIGTTARWLVPRLMDMARKRHPKLRLVVVEGNTTGLEPQLASGQLDLAILHLPVSGRDLVARLLFEEDLMLVLPQGHAMVDPGRPLGLEDLADMELILPLPGTAFRDELDAVTRPLGITLLPAAEIDGLRLIASLAFEGYGPAILPATAIPSILRARFHPVPIDGLPRRRVGVAQRSRGLPSAPPAPSASCWTRWWPCPTVDPTASTSGDRRPAAELDATGLQPSGTRGSRHMRQMGGLPDLGVELLDDLEAEPGVEGDIPFLGRLEVGGTAGLVDAVHHRLHAGPSPLPVPCRDGSVPRVARYQCGSLGGARPPRTAAGAPGGCGC